MSDRRLQVFHAVARHLSFTKAAETLHMTQPAVTFQIRQLEEHFKTRLFDRTHNRIKLTAAGQLVYTYAERIFELYAELEKAMSEMTGEMSGNLVIGASTTIAEYVLPALLGEFKRRFVEVNIALRVSNTEGIVAMVEENLIDLGMVEAPVRHGNLEIELCRLDPLVVILPTDHALIGRTSVRALELKAFPFILREEGSGTRDAVLDYLLAQGVDLAELKVSMELGSPESIKGAVEAGMGVSIVSRTTIAKELRLGTLVAVELTPPLQRPFSFVHKRQRFRLPVINELLAFARAYCRAHAQP